MNAPMASMYCTASADAADPVARSFVAHPFPAKHQCMNSSGVSTHFLNLLSTCEQLATGVTSTVDRSIAATGLCSFLGHLLAATLLGMAPALTRAARTCLFDRFRSGKAITSSRSSLCSRDLCRAWRCQTVKSGCGHVLGYRAEVVS